MTTNAVETTVCSAMRTVTIGAERPLVVIGERLNPTGRARLTAAWSRGDMALALRDAAAQEAAGADLLDINVGVPGLDQAALMRAAVTALQEATTLPLCLDSADPAVLQAGLEVVRGKALVNSVNGEAARLDRVLPLVKDYGAAVIALTMDDDGIPASAEGRLRVAERILARATATGIAANDVVVDPITLAVGADSAAARVTLDAIALIRAELGVNILLGTSNVSFGLPARPALNATYLALGMARGVTCAIANPLDARTMETIRAADLCLGHDEWATRWIRACRRAAQARSSAQG
ncbi:MAG: dihydropteroate synthase [Anaerolineales bacterium]